MPAGGFIAKLHPRFKTPVNALLLGAIVPVLFTLQMHNDTPYKLDGGHAAVACTSCHTDDDKLARKVAPARVRWAVIAIGVLLTARQVAKLAGS